MIRRKGSHDHRNINFSRKALSVHAEMANDAKLIEQNMFNQLLRPPSKKEITETNGKKFEQKFKKPDIETLIHENNLLKKEQVLDKKMIMNQKVVIGELKKKVEKLQIHDTEQAELILEQSKNSHSAHIEILKKKIHNLQTRCLLAEEQIKNLSKLPNASIFEQQNIEKQHLLAETIRLKAILISYQDQNIMTNPTFTNVGPSIQNSKKDIENTTSLQPIPSSAFLSPNGHSSSQGLKHGVVRGSLMGSQSNTANVITKFQQEFFRALKEENEKLKATSRLLENDKILLKSKQNIQKKDLNALKKELEGMRSKLLGKEAEIEKLINENKNLLFNKAAELREQNDEKESQEVQELNKRIEEYRSNNKKYVEENELLIQDNNHLKKKLKEKGKEIVELEQTNDRLRLEIADLDNKYEARIKSLKMSKMAMTVDPSKKMLTSCLKDSEINQPSNQHQWGKVVRFQEIELPLLTIWSLKNDKVIEDYHSIYSILNSQQDALNLNQIMLPLTKFCSANNLPGKRAESPLQKSRARLITFDEFFRLMQRKPFFINQNESRKLVKYIFCDHSQMKGTEPVIEWSLIETILRASINKILFSLDSPSAINGWRCRLSKNRKFLREMEESKEPSISKEVFMKSVLSTQNQSVPEEEINFLVINTFSREASRKHGEVSLDRIKILECMYGLQGNPEFMKKMLTKPQTLTRAHENQTILKIKINDDQEESLIGDNSSSYICNFTPTEIFETTKLMKKPRSEFNRKSITHSLIDKANQTINTIELLQAENNFNPNLNGQDYIETVSDDEDSNYRNLPKRNSKNAMSRRSSALDTIKDIFGISSKQKIESQLEKIEITQHQKNFLKLLDCGKKFRSSISFNVRDQPKLELARKGENLKEQMKSNPPKKQSKFLKKHRQSEFPLFKTLNLQKCGESPQSSQICQNSQQNEKSGSEEGNNGPLRQKADQNIWREVKRKEKNCHEPLKEDNNLEYCGLFDCNSISNESEEKDEQNLYVRQGSSNQSSIYIN